MLVLRQGIKQAGHVWNSKSGHSLNGGLCLRDPFLCCACCQQLCKRHQSEDEKAQTANQVVKPHALAVLVLHSISTKVTQKPTAHACFVMALQSSSLQA